MSRSALARASALAAAVLSGCISHAPRIGDPLGIEASCGSRQARSTSIASVMASTNDKLLDARPVEQEVRHTVKEGGGAIAYFNDQLLALPRVAPGLGETDGYARVRAVAIVAAPPAGATYRDIYLLVRDHKVYRWVEMQAFDTQNICVEGKPQT